MKLALVAPSATDTVGGATSKPDGDVDVVNVDPPAGAGFVRFSVAVTSLQPIGWVVDTERLFA
jgi:hypothetical protein